jgi:hypothetical protein
VFFAVLAVFFQLKLLLDCLFVAVAVIVDFTARGAFKLD